MRGIYIDDNVDELKSKLSNNNIVVLIYAPWCGHCNDMKSDWNKVTNHLKDRDDLDGFISRIQIDDVGKLNEPELEDIIGVPTIVYMNKGSKVGTYNGERKAKPIEDWILSKLGNKHVDSVVLERKKRKNRKKLSDVANKVKIVRTMYGGYNWQKPSVNKTKRGLTSKNKTNIRVRRRTTRRRTSRRKSRELTSRVVSRLNKSKGRKSKGRKSKSRKSKSRKSKSKK